MVAVVVGLVVAGCGDPGSDVRTLAKVDGWLDRHAEAATFEPTLELAHDAATARALWEEAVPGDLARGREEPDAEGRYGAFDDVDLDTHVLGLWSSGQSGSCPEWLSEVASVDEGVAVEVVVDRGPGGACTADFNPYRQVVAIPRDAVPDPDELPASLVTGPEDGATFGDAVRRYGG